MNIKTTQYKQLMKQYEEKQLQNQYQLNARRQEIYEHIPEIQHLDKEISRSSIQLAKLLINEEENLRESIQKLKEKNLELSMKKIELLHSNGYPKDYLQKKYTCDKCQDTGFVKGDKCSCFKQSLIDLAYEQSNIKALLENENFDSFSFDFYSDEVNPQFGLSPRQNIKNVYKHCLQFANSFEGNFGNIILYGNTGVGKSFLSNCIAKSLLDSGYTVIYLTAFQLFEIFEKDKFNKSDTEVYESLVEEILTCDLLIIDDLGTEFSTSLTSSQLFNCLNTRLLNKRSTLISTNLSPAAWSKHYSDRIVSRIFGYYEAIQIFGEDIRIKKAFN